MAALMILFTIFIVVVFFEILASLLGWNLHFSSPTRRIAVVTYSWILSTFAITSIYLKINDNGAALTFIFGYCAFPIILLLIWRIDRYLCNTSYFEGRYKTITLVNCIIAAALYFPGAIASMLVLALVSKYA